MVFPTALQRLLWLRVGGAATPVENWQRAPARAHCPWVMGNPIAAMSSSVVSQRLCRGEKSN
eukprot:11507479-Alexandrium_andersonii.AAC.1